MRMKEVFVRKKSSSSPEPPIHTVSGHLKRPGSPGDEDGDKNMQKEAKQNKQTLSLERDSNR